METVRLGRTNIVVNRNGFGALPVQRVNMEEAKVILKKNKYFFKENCWQKKIKSSNFLKFPSIF